MHAGEAEIGAALVSRLIAAQFPQWAQLPLKQVESAGTDNALYRLGADMVVRLPRVEGAVGQLEKEHRWLPVLAAQLPLPVPALLAMGEPGEGYPWPWSVYRWLNGENAAAGRIENPRAAAAAMAHFVAALQRIDPAGGPQPQHSRSVPLAMRNASVRDAIAALHGTIDTEAAALAWEAALQAPPWRGPDVWIHGDLHAGNLLVDQGRLSAVIDFGCLGVGDPACDMLAAWSIFSADARKAFREVLQPDDACWTRGRGWALSIGLVALPYYRSSNPIFAAIAKRMIDEAIDDHRNGA